MGKALEPETIDLAELRDVLRLRCGTFIAGEVVGRTRLRDEVARHVGCSTLEAERLVDTMVSRGVLRRSSAPDGREGWSTVGD